MPKLETILTTQHNRQDDVQFDSIKDNPAIDPISNRSIPYISLALGLYEHQNNVIQFAIDNLEQINNSKQPAETITKISKVYSVLEVYADRLGSHKIIILPQLAELYRLAKKLSDEKIATAVLTSLIARHLAFKSDISHCQQTHIDDAKKIMASTKTYFRQEAAIDAMVYMVSSLCTEPDNYQLAANQGSKAELKKLSGANIFSTQNQDKVNHIRLLLIAAQNIANQVEENYSIPKQLHLEQAAEWLAKSEAIIHHKANQVFIIKFLQEYLKVNGTLEQSVLISKQLKQDVLAGKSIEGQLKSKGIAAQFSWAAFTSVQDYAADYYFSPTDGAFKINRNNQGNGLYTAALLGMQYALKDDLDNPLHQLTVDTLSINIRRLLSSSIGIIVEQFNNIIRNNASLLSVPAVFVEELNLLKSSWQQRENLSAASKDSLDQDITNYLETIGTRYIECANSNPNIGNDIELKIIAYYYNVQIKQHSHLSDNYSIINEAAKTKVHIFYALHQGCYHELLEQQDLKTKDEKFSRSVYIEKAARVSERAGIPKHLGAAIGVLALHNHIIWHPNKPIELELLKQTISDANKKTKETAINAIKKYSDRLLQQQKQADIISLKQYANQLLKQYKPNYNEVKKEVVKRNLALTVTPNEQLSIIEKEAALSIAKIKMTAANRQLQRANINRTKSNIVIAKQIMLTALKKSADAEISLARVRQIVDCKQYSKELLAYNKDLLIEELRALGVANLQAYHAWWQNVIKEQRNGTEIAFATVNSQIDKYIVDLTKYYQQQLIEVDNHYASVLNKAIHDYNYHQRCVAEAERTSKRKRRQGMYRSFAGMAIAAFVAPYMAGSMFAPGIGCTIATGAIAGGISSGIAGGNVLKGAAMGGLFAGFGFAVDGALGEFITNNELLRESLNVAATASLSTAIYGGKVLDNVFISIGANAVAALIVPMPKFANKELTIQQANAINNRQVMRAFTRGITALAISKNSNLGTSLMIAGMSSLQTWVSHQANTFIQERRAIEQQANTVNPRSRLAIGDKQPALQPTLFTNTAGSRFNKLGYIGKGKFGGYKINLPEIQHPCAGGLQPRMPATNRPLTGVPSSSWRRFQENYTAVTNDMDIDALMYNIQSQQMSQLYDDYQVGGRIGSGIQAGFGAGQLGVAAALAETGVGIVPACLLAARGADNLVTGAMGFITGQDRPTILHQAVRGAGFSDTTAMWVEFGVDLSPVASGMAREAVHIAKGGMLKLYDLRNATIKNIRFHSEADPLLEILGHAKVSHPKEYNFIMQDLKNHAVNVQHRDGSIAFSPHTRGGTVGNTIYLPEEFSISALKHEYGHFVDHKNLGFPRHIEYFKNPQLIIATERKQYLAEIKLARELGDYNARKILTRNYLAEKEDIISKYYQQPYGHSSNNAPKLRGNS